tara:strand:+ start:204050 stop:204640 length:591 start_codon:yes stop_codon:yes gene_type:complete
LNEAMKQRLIGAVVLGCLAIIFLPILLDGEGVSTPALNTTIPVAPTFPEPLIVEPQRPNILSDSEAILLDSAAADADAAATVPQTDSIAEATQSQATSAATGEDRPALDSEGLPQAWSIRLGLFGDNANAETLVAQLLERDYRAYSQPVRTSRGELTAVFVGPVLTRTDAEALRSELSESFNLEALIVDFNIDGDE